MGSVLVDVVVVVASRVASTRHAGELKSRDNFVNILLSKKVAERNLTLGCRLLIGWCWSRFEFCFSTCEADWRKRLPLKVKTPPAPVKLGEDWTSLKKAWCSTQHFQRCLQACLEGVSKPKVLSSFCKTKDVIQVLSVLCSDQTYTHVLVLDPEHEEPALEVDLGYAWPGKDRRGERQESSAAKVAANQ